MGQKPGDLTLQYSNHPISNSYLFFQGDITADDAFQTAMLGAKQQSAIGVQRFSAALDFPVADVDDDAAAEGEAMFLPLIGDGLEPSGTDEVVVMVEFLKDFHGQGSAVLALAGFGWPSDGVETWANAHGISATTATHIARINFLSNIHLSCFGLSGNVK